MLRIVGLQRSERACGEFVLLQNQSGVRLRLGGHAVAAPDDDRCEVHVFSQDDLVPAGAFVMLASGHGSSKWGRTKDGQMVLSVFMNRERPVWSSREGPLSVLGVQHTYVPRSDRSPVLV